MTQNKKLGQITSPKWQVNTSRMADELIVLKPKLVTIGFDLFVSSSFVKSLQEH